MIWWARKVVVGFDYWQVISHYPLEMSELCEALAVRGNEGHVISAVGKGRVGTIAEVHQHWPDLHESCIHEVVFENPKQAPEEKLAKCQELGIDMVFDDRDDVCRVLNQRGILALRVTRKDGSV
jgi:hypothetical protein